MDILERVYPKVSHLEDFLKGLNGCPPLITAEDKAGYKAFLQNTLIGIPECHLVYDGPLSYQQYSEQMEIVNRVLLRLHHRGKEGKDSVLLNGFTSWKSEGDFPASINVPNNNSNQLRTPYWSKLLSRIGDELMMYIFENLSVFIPAPPSCYIQLTGSPLKTLIEEGNHGNEGCSNVSLRGEKEQGTSNRKRPLQVNKLQSDRGTQAGQQVPDCMVKGLQRSYYILNTCYSRTIGRTWGEHDIISKLPASNSGARKLTHHIFNSSKDSTLNPGKSDEKGNLEEKDDNNKKRKKIQRTCQRLIKVLALLKTLLIQHRKLKMNGILNHHCPIQVPNNAPSIEEATDKNLKNSKVKQGQSSKASEGQRSSSSSPCIASSHEKSLAELQDESRQDGYIPKVFSRQRTRHAEISEGVINPPSYVGKEMNSATSRPGSDIHHPSSSAGVPSRARKALPRKRTNQNFQSSRQVSELPPQTHTPSVAMEIDKSALDDSDALHNTTASSISSHPDGTLPIKRTRLNDVNEKNVSKEVSGSRSPSVTIQMGSTTPSAVLRDDAVHQTCSDLTNISSGPVRTLLRKRTKPISLKIKQSCKSASRTHLRDVVISTDTISSQVEDTLQPARSSTSSSCQRRLSGKRTKERATDCSGINVPGIGMKTNATTSVFSQPKRKKSNRPPTDENLMRKPYRTNARLEKSSKIKHGQRKSTIAKIRMQLPSDAGTLIKMKTEPLQVWLFLRHILLKVVPDELWGSIHNRNVFLKGVKKFVQLGHYEKLSLRALIDDIRVEDCEWSKLEKFKGREPPFTSLVKERQMVTDFFHWLMIGYTIPLIMMCFYVTETSMSRNQLVFYRKPVWLVLEKLGIQYYVAYGTMRPVKESEAQKLVSAGLTLGFSRLRFVPKTKSLRPITRMGKSISDQKKGLSVKLLLQDLFDVLMYQKMNKPSIMGCSLLGIDGIYPKVLHFVQERKAKSDERQVFFAKVDIEKCYDTIKQSKLQQIIAMLLSGQNEPDEYQIHRYITVTRTAAGKLQSTARRHVTTELSQSGSFHRRLIELSQDGQIKNAIIINQVHTVKVTPTTLLERLKQHIMTDVVKSGRKYYLRQNGISQGSILSSLLCSLFYTHLERCFLSDIDQDGLMMRLIDDFILITPHQDKAERFLQLLLSGVKQYGCSANRSKTLTNFEFKFDGQLVPMVSESFPWCGIVFNTKTLNVSNDYTRYNNVSIRYTLTICTEEDTALYHMRNKLAWSLRAKNVSIFMDPQINSFRTIVINAHHLLLLLAFRFHSYYYCLDSDIKENTRPLQFYNIWSSCVRMLYTSTLSKLPKDIEGEETMFPLTLNTVSWIGLKALDTKLNIHRGLYHPLIKLVRKYRRKTALKMGKPMLDVLEAITSPALPEDFTRMKR